jgi:hypothetical protein
MFKIIRNSFSIVFLSCCVFWVPNAWAAQPSPAAASPTTQGRVDFEVTLMYADAAGVDQTFFAFAGNPIAQVVIPSDTVFTWGVKGVDVAANEPVTCWYIIPGGKQIYNCSSLLGVNEVSNANTLRNGNYLFTFIYQNVVYQRQMVINIVPPAHS